MLNRLLFLNQPYLFYQEHDMSYYEDADYLYLELSVPGAQHSDITIQCLDDRLHVTALPLPSDAKKGVRFYQLSRRAFDYEIFLPHSIMNTRKPEITLLNGILNIKYVKLKSTKAQQTV